MLKPGILCNTMTGIRLVPYWNVNTGIDNGVGASGIIRLVPYWNVNPCCYKENIQNE